MQLALGETLHRGAGVAEQQAASAVAVEQLAHQARRGLRIAIVDGAEQGFAFITEEVMDGFMRGGLQAALVEQFLHRFGDRLVIGALGAERLQVMETMRIEQTQAGEVAVLAELFRGGG